MVRQAHHARVLKGVIPAKAGTQTESSFRNPISLLAYALPCLGPRLRGDDNKPQALR
jgi:hypothetical protein